MTYAQQLRNEGMPKGMQARTIEIAKSMLKDGKPFNRIMQWTGLDEETLRELRLL